MCIHMKLLTCKYLFVYKYLKENNSLCEKQFGFQSGYSTNNAIIRFADKNFDSFEQEQFTLGIFINFSKAFDTVDHSILLKKMKFHGVADKNPACFESYLSYRNHYIHISENNKTDPKYVTCGVSHVFIFVPILFLIYVNDLPNASHLFYRLMFLNDTNLFFDQKDIKHLFTVPNKELVEYWFTAKKVI